MKTLVSKRGHLIYLPLPLAPVVFFGLLEGNGQLGIKEVVGPCDRPPAVGHEAPSSLQTTRFVAHRPKVFRRMQGRAALSSGVEVTASRRAVAKGRRVSGRRLCRTLMTTR